MFAVTPPSPPSIAPSAWQPQQLHRGRGCRTALETRRGRASAYESTGLVYGIFMIAEIETSGITHQEVVYVRSIHLWIAYVCKREHALNRQDLALGKCLDQRSKVGRLCCSELLEYRDKLPSQFTYAA